MQDKVLVSACLAGKNCRYDGKSQRVDYVCDLVKRGIGVCICPEQMGGLDTPRVPSERVGDLVLSKEGKDVTIIATGTMVYETLEADKIVYVFTCTVKPEVKLGNFKDVEVEYEEFVYCEYIRKDDVK